MKRFAAFFLSLLLAGAALAQVPIYTRPSSGLSGGTLPSTAFPLLAPDGTAGAPSYSFSGAPGTGMWRNSAGRITFSISGSAGVAFSSSSVILGNAGFYAWTSSSDPNGTGDTFLGRDGAAGSIGQRNGANAQRDCVYNNFTDASNYERGCLDWITTANTMILGTRAAGTGTARDLQLTAASGANVNVNAGGSNRWQFATGGGFLASSDNATDIGAAGATRPRSGYFGTGVNAPRFNAIGGSSPTVGGAACGTSGSVTGMDSAHIVTVGTGGTATTCVVTFSATWTNPPVCIAQNNTDRVAYSIASTATQYTITATAAFSAGGKFYVQCMGQ
jgi:hypothetical protein